jgi:hypothetical protein
MVALILTGHKIGVFVVGFISIHMVNYMGR